MKTRPVVPARIDFDPPAPPFAADFGDVYHPRAGALEQARHVFLAGNHLPDRWQGHARFAVLETGFGLGHNFVATWDAWRSDPRRCRKLVYLSIDRHPPRREDLARAHQASPLPRLARALIEQWPALTPNLHRIGFDDARVELLLLFADIGDAVRQVVGRFDAFFLDGFAPARNPAMWQPPVLKAIGRLAARDATAATWSVARELRDGLAAAGFEVRRVAGFGAKREMTAARFAPRHVPAIAPGRAVASTAREAIVIGAGLAGCATAATLAAEGLQVRLFDRGPAPASGASGQPAGIFHGTVHRSDGVHARFTRAAALQAEIELRAAIGERGVAGSASGFLRLAGDADSAEALRAIVDAQRLPPPYVDALDAASASARAGVAVAVPAWFYPGGGWVDPAALAASWLAHRGIEAHWGRGIGALRRAGERWQLLDADGRVVADSTLVVLAPGAEGVALLDPALPLAVVRGQTTIVGAGTAGLAAPRLPVADAGYALTLPDGRVLAGASSDAGDDLAPRAADIESNLARLARLTGSRIDAASAALESRVGVRLVAVDRLPVVGAMPAIGAPPATTRRPDQPRFVAREPGLYACTALGSRGITWAPLAARLLAAQIVGAPWPLEADLADAVDPARFIARAARTSTC